MPQGHVSCSFPFPCLNSEGGEIGAGGGVEGMGFVLSTANAVGAGGQKEEEAALNVRE